MANSEVKKYRKVLYCGEVYAEVGYADSDWCGWLFKTSKEPRKYWKFVKEIGLYVCNTSIGTGLKGKVIA